jgi:hypothetical protein
MPGRYGRWQFQNVHGLVRMTPAMLLNGYQGFGGIYCLHFQGKLEDI